MEARWRRGRGGPNGKLRERTALADGGCCVGVDADGGVRARLDGSCKECRFGGKKIGVRETERRGKNGRGKMTDRGKARGRTRGRPAKVPIFSRKFILFSSRDSDNTCKIHEAKYH
jgi:hypothetical protein